MTIRPDSGPEYGEEELESWGVLPEEAEDLSGEFASDPVIADNEAHAPGKTCERCGSAITAHQDARRRPDGRWVHEVCPPHLPG
jgi:hypothetical protein